MKKIYFIASRLVGTHGVTVWSPHKNLSIKILILPDLIIESAVREREVIQSGDEQEQLIICMADMEVQIFLFVYLFLIVNINININIYLYTNTYTYIYIYIYI